jgi:Uma2 family endonuclease
LVSVQDPIVLDDYTEPQPDLILLKWRDDYYADQLPVAQDAFVVIEVADTTLQYDRAEKLPRYAAAGIPEVWIVDAQSETVEQYLSPQGNEYREKKVIARGDRLICRAIDGLELDGVDILGP